MSFKRLPDPVDVPLVILSALRDEYDRVDRPMPHMSIERWAAYKAAIRHSIRTIQRALGLE